MPGNNKIFRQLNKEFKFPFQPHDFQEKAVLQTSKRDCSLIKFKVGLGKTAVSTWVALLSSLNDDVEQILILCPPILLDQWYAFLKEIDGIPSISIYRGAPAERKKMDLEESVILVSYNIFRGKRDFKRFQDLGKRSKLCIIADELSLKSLGSTYKKVKDLLYRKMRTKKEDKSFHKLIALNATPISDFSHIYNWCALMTPGTYISKRMFELTHVLKSDHWGNVLLWADEAGLKKNMGVFSIDTDKEIKLPPLIETVVPYSLEGAHLKLYNEVKESQLQNLPEEKIELALNSMFSLLQRLILVPREFGLDIDPPILNFIDGYLDQMGDEDGVLIYTRHVVVSKLLAEKVPDCGAIYGGVSKQSRADTFKRLQCSVNPLRRLVGNLDSLGKGLNLQVLNHILYTELPFRSDAQEQSLGRTHRQGQKKTCFASYPIAIGTLQEGIYQKLLKNGEDINRIMKTKKDVREFLGG